MHVKFKEGVNEYSNGEYHRKNDGKPFEVDSRFAADVLLASGNFVEYVPPKPKTEPEITDSKPAKEKK